MTRVPASFRDPSGFVFHRDNRLLRQINRSYREPYDHLMSSGLYERLTDSGLLIAHREVDDSPADPASAYKTIVPQRVPFLSWPYEWCFGQLKDAALATLRIQLEALRHDMILKDASAFNMQFLAGRPVLIDTLSFEIYREGEAWVAYRQFCQHFLAPLSLIAYGDVRLHQLTGRVFIDGVPLDLAASLLPARSWLRPSLLTHIHLQARSQRYFADKGAVKIRQISRRALLGMVENLKRTVERLEWKIPETEWGGYYRDTNYTPAGFEHKQECVGRFLDLARPSRVWDLGGNVGLFSRLAASRNIEAVCFDADPAAVERNYRQCRRDRETRLLPLLLDLTNPSPPLGWQNQERSSLLERGPVEGVLALALVHHLAISNNLPLPRLAEFFATLCGFLAIEFVPKNDSQVQRLLASRKDVFDSYNEDSFRGAFSQSFEILERIEIRDSRRTLYVMKNRKQFQDGCQEPGSRLD